MKAKDTKCATHPPADSHYPWGHSIYLLPPYKFTKTTTMQREASWLNQIIAKYETGVLATLIEQGHLLHLDAYDRLATANTKTCENLLALLADFQRNRYGPEGEEWAHEIESSFGPGDHLLNRTGFFNDVIQNHLNNCRPTISNSDAEQDTNATKTIEAAQINSLEPKWHLKTKLKMQGYRGAVHEAMQFAHTNNLPCPNARQLKDIWEKAPPPGIIVEKYGINYETAVGIRKFANIEAIQATIDNLKVKTTAQED